MTPVPSSGATPVPSIGATGQAGQAQIGADKKEMRKLMRQDSCSICENLRNLRIEY